MKKIFTILLVAVAIVVAPAAQAQLRFGVKLGANISNFNGDFENLDLENTQLANFTGGVMAEWIFAYGVGVDLGLQYTAKGSEYRVGDDVLGSAVSSLLGTNSMVKNVVHYVEVPVNLKYKLQIPTIEEIVIPFVYVGPSFAFKVGEAITFGDKPLDLNNSTIRVNNSAVDCAMNVGLGVELIKHLNVAVQYGWGLGKVTDIELLNTSIFGDKAIRSGAWTITAAWMF